MSEPDSTRRTFLLRLRDREDELSWPEFHERYGELLYRYARARGASHADAEDVVQEVELSLFKTIDRFEYDARRGRFRGYLRAAVVRALGRRASREARQPAGLDPATFDHLADQSAADADEHWEREWELYRLRRAVRTMAADFEPVALKAFEMHVLAGRSVRETAEQLGISIWSVYRARDSGLKRLKERLATLDPDNDA
jgi:RNA polymerase sigma-70 factor (ECF subfamily)